MRQSPLLVLVLLAGCASTRPVAWQGVGGNLNGHAVTLQGTIESLPAAGTLHLCPNGRSDLSQCIDVVASQSISAALRSGTCSAISGKFTAFGPDTVGIGNFRSSIGFIEVARAGPCNER
jgi:hypothetical protein